MLLSHISTQSLTDLLGDNKFDQESMDETFLLSNILPQNFENNGNFWYRMEGFCRNLTKQFSDVYVISGPLWLPFVKDGKKIVEYEVKCFVIISYIWHAFKGVIVKWKEPKYPRCIF